MRGVRYMNQTGSAPSGLIWHDCPLEAIDAGRVRGYHLWEDFINFPNLVDLDADLHKWAAYSDSTSIVSQLPDEIGGVLKMTADGANETAIITTGGNKGGFVKILDPATASGAIKVWFEARWKVSTISNTQCGIFVGLTEEGLAVADGVIKDDGLMEDKDYIGFHRLEGDGDQIDVVHNKDGGTDQTVIANAFTLVADTFVKTGFTYDPSRKPSERIIFYFDNVAQGTFVTADTITGANFPDNEELGATIAIEMAATGSPSVEIDWIKVVGLELE